MSKNKKKIGILCWTILIVLVATAQVHAQGGIDPYVEAGDYLAEKASKPIEINPDNINVLTAQYATISAILKPVVQNFMFLWLESSAPEIYRLECKVNSPKAGVYKLNTLVLVQDAKIELTCNGDKLEAVNN